MENHQETQEIQENQIYPEVVPEEKNFVLPVGVPMSAAPKPAKKRKARRVFPFQVQVPGMVFTGSVCLISLLMSINSVYTTKFSLDIVFYRTCCDFVKMAYWGLIFCFAAMAIASPEYLADDKPDISKIWPLVTASFLRFFWMLEKEMDSKNILVHLLGRVLLLVGFYFCYFAGSSAWPLGNLFKPWVRIPAKPVVENIEEQVGLAGQAEPVEGVGQAEPVEGVGQAGPFEQV